jgi:hypothetical protein
MTTSPIFSVEQNTFYFNTESKRTQLSISERAGLSVKSNGSELSLFGPSTFIGLMTIVIFLYSVWV